MKKDLIANENEVTLTSPSGTPFCFTIKIKGAAPRSLRRSFEVSRQNSIEVHKYSLFNGNHKSYINFFEKLAKDFGTRPPQNRQEFGKATFKATYRLLLDHNLAPGMRDGYGDPAVLLMQEKDNKNSWYYLLSTSNDAPDSFPIIRSRDLKDWKFVGFVFPRDKKPEWAADGKFISDYWAPEMCKIGNEFRVYFVARDKNTRELCIGMAKAPQPDADFIPEREPILRGNVIDPHVLVRDDNTAYLYWKQDNNALWPSRLNNLLYKHPQFICSLFLHPEDHITASLITTLWPWTRTLEPMERFLVQQILVQAATSSFSDFQNRLTDLLNSQNKSSIQNNIRAVLQVIRTPIYAQRLSPDGTSLIGERTKILENDQEWESHLVEGIWITKQREKYYLFYAGNDFSTDQYGIGVAISNSPLGPYQKMSKPFLSSTKYWSGPGHPSVVEDPNGVPLLLFHAYEPGKIGYKEFRFLLAVPIRFQDDCVLLR